MNEITLDLAATYVNEYRNAHARQGTQCNESQLRDRVARLFGATYAAILIR